MQLQLKQTELETAVREYIVNMGISRPVGNVKFTPTRGSEGVLTEVELDDLGATAPVVTLVEDEPIPEKVKEPTKAKKPAKEAGETVAPEEETTSAEESATVDPSKSLFG